MQISELFHLYTPMTKIRNISCTSEAPFCLLSWNTPGEVSTSLTSITQLCLHWNFTDGESNLSSFIQLYIHGIHPGRCTHQEYSPSLRLSSIPFYDYATIYIIKYWWYLSCSHLRIIGTVLPWMVFWVHGYVIWWKYSIICRMQHLLFEDFGGEGVVVVNNNTLVRIQEKWAVGKSINWNNLSGRQSGNRHKKPKNIYALWLIMLLQGNFLLSIYMAQIVF